MRTAGEARGRRPRHRPIAGGRHAIFTMHIRFKEAVT